METAARASRRELRNFGLLLGGLFALIFGALPLVRGHHPPLWPFVLCAALWILAILVPSALRPIHAGWTRLGLALGWVNTRIVLSLIFFIVMVPAGLVMRLLGRDKLGKRYAPGLGSYRAEGHKRSPQSVERPY
jgi:Saxitoxin biosynthesis operon protein SxtJ